MDIFQINALGRGMSARFMLIKVSRHEMHCYYIVRIPIEHENCLIGDKITPHDGWGLDQYYFGAEIVHLFDGPDLDLLHLFLIFDAFYSFGHFAGANKCLMSALDTSINVLGGYIPEKLTDVGASAERPESLNLFFSICVLLQEKFKFNFEEKVLAFLRSVAKVIGCKAIVVAK